MDIYTAERYIDIETNDLLGPELELRKAQGLCQVHEKKPLAWKPQGRLEDDGWFSWHAKGEHGVDYYVTKWEVT